MGLERTDVDVGAQESMDELLAQLEGLLPNAHVRLTLPAAAVALQTADDFTRLREMMTRQGGNITIATPDLTLRRRARIFGFPSDSLPASGERSETSPEPVPGFQPHANPPPSAPNLTAAPAPPSASPELLASASEIPVPAVAIPAAVGPVLDDPQTADESDARSTGSHRRRWMVGSVGAVLLLGIALWSWQQSEVRAPVEVSATLALRSATQSPVRLPTPVPVQITPPTSGPLGAAPQVTPSQAQTSAGLATTPSAPPLPNPSATPDIAPTVAPPVDQTPTPPLPPPSATVDVATAAALRAPTETAATHDLLHLVSSAETGLRTGQLLAIMDYGGGTRASTEVRFDLGSVGHPPALQARTSYTSTIGTQTSERISIGGQAWERIAASGWHVLAQPSEVAAQLQAFLPHADTALAPTLTSTAHEAELHWYNSSRDVDVVLHADPITGRPHDLRETSRTTGSVLTVNYAGWNTPVVIVPPRTR